MTLNQLIQRLQNLAQSHKQLHDFRFGDVTEWLAGSDIKYPACFIDIANATIDRTNHQSRYQVQIWLCDLINVAQDSRANEVEVFSDLMSIMEDLLALINDPNLQDDWTPGEAAPVQLMKEKFEDWTGAVMTTLDIATDYLSDNCQVPKY